MKSIKEGLKPLKARISRSRSPGPAPKASRASTVYEGFKTTLRVIEKSSDVFPPLKSAVGGLLGLIDVLENVRRNDEDSTGLKNKLDLMLSVMKNSKMRSDNAEARERIEKLSRSLEIEVVNAKNIQSRGALAKAANVSKDREDIAATYREISRLLDMFLVETTLAVEKIAVDTHKVTSRHFEIALLYKLQCVDQALYNATSPVPRRSCTNNTRREILADFLSWALDKDDNKIYYLNGMAGTGKTTLAYTLSQILASLGLLRGTFFCSRADHNCSDANRIASTLASQLSRICPAFCDQLIRVLDENAGRPGENIDLRFSNLIVIPSKAAATSITKPIIVIIDALDECSNDSHVLTLMNNLWSSASDLPIKFFVTSRPERPFHDKLYGKNEISTKYHLHNVEDSLVERDIRLFIEERLQTLANDYRNSGLPVSYNWPPENQLNALTKQSGKLFIYASTACQYIGGSKLDLSERLDWVVDIGREASRAQTDPLDSLYKGVLEDAYEGCEDAEIHTLNEIIGAVITTITPLSINALAELLRTNPERLMAGLSHFHSVLNVPSDGSLVTTLHASFPDYLSDLRRSQQFYLDSARSHSMLASFSLKLMEKKLRENMCNQDGFPNSNLIPEATLQQCIGPALAYACRYWSTHFCASCHYKTSEKSLRDEIFNFIELRSLMWVECLSYIRALYRSIPLLGELEEWVSKTDQNLASQILDVRRYVSQNIELLSINALESYNSALLWLPEKSFIRQKFSSGRRLPKVIAGLAQDWYPCEMIFTGHSDYVKSVAFSPDGARTASGSDDKTIRIWNATTGELERELTGHSDYVRSVAFSPDGARIASGSDDNTVRIWNATTGEPEREFSGHSSHVTSVAFSPDGARIASGSRDKTVRIWNATTGESERELTGHSDYVRSAAFSPDGARIASGSDDNTVRIWNATTDESEHKLTGHSDYVMSVAFSPDGARIASGSRDKTVRIWNATTGRSERNLTGHSDYVRSVVFSPDGAWFASGSDDNTVRIWNATTGESERELTGHSDYVNSVAFSPDSARIASGSRDKTVRIWNASTGESKRELTGHSDYVNSVAFSPDGARIASGSDDNTVRIWNATTGRSERNLTGHSDSVRSVVFSPDGARFASGSDDNTVRIWNAATGKSERELTGHSNSVWSVAFSPDGAQIASGSLDNTVRIWNATTGESERELTGHSESVRSVAFSPGGARIASGSHDNTVRIWNATTGESRREFTANLHWVMSVAFSPDGTRVFAKDVHGVVVVWDATNGELQQDSRQTKLSFPYASDDCSLLRLSEDKRWLINSRSSRKYWIPPEYANFTEISICFRSKKAAWGYNTGRVVIITV